MTAARTATDVGFGLAIAFGVLSILAALGTTATSYVYAIEESGFMQLLSGVSVALAIVFAALGIAVLHLYGE